MAKGRWCRICGCQRRNEAFSGRGHRNCICKECQKLPKALLERIDIGNELCGYIGQKNISEKNIARLVELTAHEDPDLREHAEALLDIARVHPRRKKRWKRLVETQCHLVHRYLVAAGDEVRGEIGLTMDLETRLMLDDYEADLSASAIANQDIPF
ncbi:MAG: hypothetical protein HN849_08100 [Victivallales bacterium]|jgi:hypothetical protein|nr:hypothetical protein [Victivallales bacterium]MBT7161398.1 hypothetical protein [Victivallales bacterium]MBT7299458.1 hypothetical protein [Victivallales bacterium]